jgi:SAM-dependent methyltransferase
MNLNKYDSDFYRSEDSQAIISAKIIIPMVLDVLPPSPNSYSGRVNSVVDFGCGTGAFLSVAQQFGIIDIRGLDGPWIRKELLRINEEYFTEVNFMESINLDRKYDLAISLEVAEHLAPNSAEGFIDSITRASDLILFSAAIPYQGGVNHVNEQWPDYWNKLFKERGYIAVDFLRKKIWYDERIAIHYRQNILLFIKEARIDEIDVDKSDVFKENPPCSFVHSDHYINSFGWKNLISILWKKCVKNFSKRIFRSFHSFK